jgi:hypothetical protein
MRIAVATAALLLTLSAAWATDLAITAKPYLQGGLCTRPVLPMERDTVSIAVRATVTGECPAAVPATVTVSNAEGRTQELPLALAVADGLALGSVQWPARRNGLYTVRVCLDPADAVPETDEANNGAELLLPVTVFGRRLNCVWYRAVPGARWTTCATSVNDDAERQLLDQHGVAALHWEYGGMSWNYYSEERAAREPEAVLAEFEQLFDEKFMRPLPEDCAGLGIDETGGYPGSFTEQASIASMKSLIRAQQKLPERVFAVWHGGGLSLDLAKYYRQAADLLLLETYVFRPIASELRGEDIYQTIQDRLDPVVRGMDMITPAYGSPCHTLIALDTSERPDWIDLGELEQVVRFIRRICPEMRGIAWYNSGYGGYGLQRTPATDAHHAAVLAAADRLFFEYYVKPCLSLQRESVWLSPDGKGGRHLVAAVSNLGGVDSGPVTVELRVDGRPVGRQRAARVPAAASRAGDRVLLRQPVALTPGAHEIEARIAAAPGATVLDAVHRCQVFADSAD